MERSSKSNVAKNSLFQCIVQPKTLILAELKPLLCIQSQIFPVDMLEDF